MTKRRSIYEMGISRELINQLGARDLRALKRMNTIIMKKYDGQKVTDIDTYNDLSDWIQEYREEGHVL